MEQELYVKQWEGSKLDDCDAWVIRYKSTPKTMPRYFTPVCGYLLNKIPSNKVFSSGNNVIFVLHKIFIFTTQRPCKMPSYPNVCVMLKHSFCMDVFIRNRHLEILGISSDNTTTIKRSLFKHTDTFIGISYVLLQYHKSSNINSRQCTMRASPHIHC